MKYYYHIRQSASWGNRAVIEPKEDGVNRSELEPMIPRICVAPTIAQCIVALGNLLNESPIYVYRSAFQIHHNDVVEPYEVADSMITDETWLCEPTEFILDRIIEDHNYWTAPCAGSGCYDMLALQDSYLKRIKNDVALK